MSLPHTLRLTAATFAAVAGLNFLAIASVAQDQPERPLPGVAYGMPEGTEKFAAGTLVPYGGYNYVAQGDGSMMLAAQQPQRQGKPLPPVRQAAPQAAAAPATTTRVIYYPTATVVRTVAPNWSYSSYSFGGYGGFGPLYGPIRRTYGWGGWAGPGIWGPFGPFGPPGFGPYIGFW